MRGLRASVTLERPGFSLDVDIEAPPGKTTAVVGPSGAGKSTLLRCLAGLERAQLGRVEVDGELWQDSGIGRFVSPHLRAVGLVSQDGALFPNRTVQENLEYGWRRLAPTRRRLGLREVAERLGLAELLHRRPAGLSGGEARRVALARALLRSPRLLLLDEPLAGLDGGSREQILPFLETLAESLEGAMVYVTHGWGEVLRLAHRAVALKDGRVAAAGPVSALATDPWVEGEMEEIAAVLEARVSGHDTAASLTLLETAAGILRVPGRPLPSGSRYRVRIQARDVSLALDLPGRTSILNVLPSRVAQVRHSESPQPLVVLDAGGVQLLARISRRSLFDLRLVPGQEVYAQVKGVALVR